MPDGAARFMTMLYILTFMRSCAVTITSIPLSPTPKGISDEEPRGSGIKPFTVTVAVASYVVGVTKTVVTSLSTFDVYLAIPGENAGDRIAPVSTRLANTAL